MVETVWEFLVSKTHPKPDECSHQSTVSVIAHGFERVVCEDCGHVSIRYESMIAGDVERSVFSRRADAQDVRLKAKHEA